MQSPERRELSARVSILRELLAVTTRVPVTVYGDSMRPYLRSGDRVWLRALLPEEHPRLGAIIAVSFGEYFSLHRTQAARRSTMGLELLVAGDANGCSDGWFPRERIVGIVVDVEPVSGFLHGVAPLWRVWRGGLRRLRSGRSLTRRVTHGIAYGTGIRRYAGPP